MTRSSPQLACLLSWLLSAAPVYTSRGQGSSLGKTEFFGSYISCVFNCYFLLCELHLLISIIRSLYRNLYRLLALSMLS